MPYYAKTDIISPSKGTMYAAKGTELTISHYSGNVVFCSITGGELFPCHVDKITEVKPKPDVVVKQLSAKEAELIEKYKQSLL